MRNCHIYETIRDISPSAWNACFANVVENYDYLLAVEKAGIQGFAWAYAAVEEDGKLIAAMPAFRTDYSLDTTLQGFGKTITNSLKSAFPNLLTLKLACLGSPCTEAGMAGFHPDVSTGQKPGLLHVMLSEFERYAGEYGCKLVGIKDLPESEDAIWKSAARTLKYASLPGMPTAYLDIDFATMEEYMARLSPATRKDMRRKLKISGAVEIQQVTTLDANLLPQVMALYRDTKARSDWQFEELTEAYFRGVLTHMPQRSFCTLYYVHGQMLAANLLIHDQHTLIDKFFCMSSENGREYNLYFLSWLTNIRYCLQHGIRRYQSGQEGYENKLRLGSKLIRNHMLFKHRNTFAHSILKLAAPLLAADETLKEAA